MKLKGNIASGLVTFEVAAELGSFTQAAIYLNITTGAISQQINLLEEQLSIILFERHSRGVRLTQAGQQLYKVVKSSLEDISEVIAALHQEENFDGEVRLKLTPSFAFKWLVPRLERFYNRYPNISIQTFAEGALVDHQSNNFDLAIDYSQSANFQQKSDLFLSEQLLPVMSPEYFKAFKWQDTSVENQQTIWQSVTLLHDAQPWHGASKNTEWQYWFNHMGITADSLQGHYFNRTDMAMAAAEAGLGIAMARYALVEEDFKQGKLVSPFNPIAANAGYYLIQHHSSSAINCFKQWLLDEKQKFIN
ncbi:LysR family transcriptional regulator [Colwellia sp. MB3u-70]|uniref:LysR substrate-binding domain-containing protein n=1 Tax=unclassified Colwellia TaxID=196834 RepID=UPI0015F716BB|nr:MULTISPECIES: LysR substrate-binding domain-containing protein [unclassified Colwellia]MBA6293667.1 LysR family transcriptional regulator [Colwellia sp. MB3u-8]MBA6308906.1 LysR family transcriptional regulator [Colwellia sp. MB3u-70]